MICFEEINQTLRMNEYETTKYDEEKQSNMKSKITEKNRLNECKNILSMVLLWALNEI